VVAIYSLLERELLHDILRQVGAWPNGTYISVLFFFFSESLLQLAELLRVVVKDSLLAKGADMVVFEVVARTRVGALLACGIALFEVGSD
jgi:hypothetical protein